MFTDLEKKDWKSWRRACADVFKDFLTPIQPFSSLYHWGILYFYKGPNHSQSWMEIISLKSACLVHLYYAGSLHPSSLRWLLHPETSVTTQSLCYTRAIHYMSSCLIKEINLLKEEIHCTLERWIRVL